MTRNRLPALVAGLTALTMAPGFIALGSAPAQAAPPAVPTAVTATTSVDTVAARVLGVTLPLPLGSLSAADIELGDVDGAVSGTDPRSSAHAANLDAAAVGLPLAGILSEADQDAPPDNPAPVTATTIASVDAAPLVTAGVSNSSAHSRFSSDATCLPPGTPLSTSTTSTTDIEAVALPGVGSLLALPGEVTTTQSISLASTGGARDARRVTARTSSTIASADLFGSLDVGVSAPPQITATATGTSPASVTYNQPVVTVSGPGLPQDVVLDAANETAAFALPENPLLGLELSLGALTRTEAADGTRASGSAALLHVRLFLVNALTPDPSDGVDVALLDLVPMEATASAPLGGITCAEATDPAVSLEQPADGTSTNDSTPTASGTAEPGASIVVTDEDGTTVCTTTASPQGTWSCTGSTPLAAGDHTFTATATDEAGTTATDTSTFTVDTQGDSDPANDSDGDGISDADEVDTDGNGPDTGTGTDPLKADTDGDGLTDGKEVTKTRTDPLDRDTDNDTLSDGQEVNGMTIKERFEICGQKKARKSIRVTTNPLVKDTDKDGLSDGREVKGYVIKQRVTFTRSGQTFKIGKTRSNPTKADTDKDGLKDKVEKKGSANKRWSRRKTDPTKCDTDQGGARDGREVRAGSDPTRIKSGPNDLMRRTGRSSIG